MSAVTPRLEPIEIATETFLISAHQVLDIAGDPTVLPINAMLIRGAQPIVVDTGAPIHREQLLGDLFSLVEPNDVRWVFLSHDDVDHSGNVGALLSACPNATVVTTWLATQRMAEGGVDLPHHRCLWLGDDDVFDAGDRALTLVRPPLYDAPATRGLLDTQTSVYWAADCFSALLPQLVGDAADADAPAWREGFTRFHQWNSPWFESVDAGWWQRAITRFEARQLRAVATAHGPVIRGHHLARAIEVLRELPALPVAAQPGNELLDQLLSPRPADRV